MRRFRLLLSIFLIAALTAATPTANKGYEKPSVQGDSNVWGNLLNGNFDAIDANLAGIATVPISSPQTTASAAQAQNLIQKLTGTLTANTTYLLPAAQSLYIVDNETSGSFVLTVQTVAPGSQGTQVSQGARNLLYSDGINVFQAGPTGLPPTGAAGGDLTGNYPNPTVVTGTSASNIVRLNGSAQLPAVDGSQVTGIFPTGAIIWYSGTSAPPGWVIGNGQAVSRTGATAALFAVEGTSYGAGDGTTTFNVIDCRGSVIAGQDPGNATGRLTAATAQGVSAAAMGNRGGEQAHTQTLAELVNHTHTVNDPGHAHNFTVWGNNGGGPAHAQVVASTGPSGTDTTALATTGISINSAGSSAAMNTVQPTVIATCLVHE